MTGCERARDVTSTASDLLLEKGVTCTTCTVVAVPLVYAQMLTSTIVVGTFIGKRTSYTEMICYLQSTSYDNPKNLYTEQIL